MGKFLCTTPQRRHRRTPAQRIMNKPQDPEAAKPVQTTSVPAVDLPRLVRLLPCPFCGSPAKTYHDRVTCSNTTCKMHFAAVPDMHTQEEWNERWGCDECVSYRTANEQLRKDLTHLESSRHWHRVRVELLSAFTPHMRDPERQLVCDILANGQILPDPEGKRYGIMIQPMTRSEVAAAFHPPNVKAHTPGAQEGRLE